MINCLVCVCGCRTSSEFAKGCIYSIDNNMCIYIYGLYVLTLSCIYIYIHLHVYVYIYICVFVLVQDTCYCLQVFTSVYLDDLQPLVPVQRVREVQWVNNGKVGRLTKDQQGPKKMFNNRIW